MGAVSGVCDHDGAGRGAFLTRLWAAVKKPHMHPEMQVPENHVWFIDRPNKKG